MFPWWISLLIVSLWLGAVFSGAACVVFSFRLMLNFDGDNHGYILRTLWSFAAALACIIAASALYDASVKP